ncbi:MAG: LysM peptidoglycan-binding domain-containing protein [Verrucomicrobiales bacterium]|nr:LysM peptidoglycan-binding domain-containing protein [Verrucomicrobiales bacterium]
MTSGIAKTICGLGILLAMLLGSGCDRWESGSQNEAHEANYIEGNNLRMQGQTNRAIQSFERALHANPANSLAHMAIADLFRETEDYTSAAYHYNRCSRLLAERGVKPDPALPGLLEQCELRLALKYSDRLGRQQTDARIDELRQKVAERDDTLQKLQQELARLRLATNAAAPAPGIGTLGTVARETTPVPVRTSPAPVSPSSNPTAADATPPSSPNPATARPASTRTPPPAATPSATPRVRTYTVRSGDTASSIARRAGVTTKALLAANPGLNPTRMRVGQTVNIPNP